MRRPGDAAVRRLTFDVRPFRDVLEARGGWNTLAQLARDPSDRVTAGPTRLDGVRVIGVDEHRWAHTRHADGDGYVTVIVDLTDVVAGHGPARLLDLVPVAPPQR